ncbi:hypothetical protein, partial [uncultured Lamprocystis sp.]|uniref:hypothetical protein n=1 Tax=uncultured Lamprocystis sp. TaxID=543132 RepID=UPI0025E1AF8E
MIALVRSTDDGRPVLQQFQIWAAPRDLWWMRRARPPCRVPATERRALSTLQRSRFRRVDKRSASTIGHVADTLFGGGHPSLELL